MLQNILTNPLMSHGLLWWCLYFLTGQGKYTVYTFSMEGHKALRLHLKYLKLCSEDVARFIQQVASSYLHSNLIFCKMDILEQDYDQ